MAKKKKPFVVIPDAVDRACYRAHCHTLSLPDLEQTIARQADAGDQICETIATEVLILRKTQEKIRR